MKALQTDTPPTAHRTPQKRHKRTDSGSRGFIAATTSTSIVHALLFFFCSGSFGARVLFDYCDNQRKQRGGSVLLRSRAPEENTE